LISDNEPGLTDAVDAKNRQLCILHALKHLLFTLWGDGMSKDDRLKVEETLKETLFTLVNSTKKYPKDQDNCRLQRRIDKTLRALNKIARELEKGGHVRAAEFIRKNGKFTVMFAQLALQGITFLTPPTESRDSWAKSPSGASTSGCTGQLKASKTSSPSYLSDTQTDHSMKASRKHIFNENIH